MSSELFNIKGLELKSISFDMGYTNLDFGTTHYLRISNDVLISLNQKISENNLVVNVISNERYVEFSFGVGGFIKILLEDENYVGPEAFTMNTPRGFLVYRTPDEYLEN